jgi:uncharacterized phage protein (TIGR02220 family)
MSNPPAFQLYAADFYMDTATWENEDVGAYLRLLLYEWINGGIPVDTYKLSKIVKISERKFKKTWENLSPKFHLNGNGMYINDRLEEEREKQRKFRELQSQKGKLGGRPIKSPGLSPGLTDPLTEQKPNESLQSSSSSSLKEVKILSGKPDHIPFSEIINYLNQTTHKNFSSKIKSTRQHIQARWNEGRVLQDFKRVVDIKFEKWGSDPKMVDFLRPETLFGTKMESYLNENISEDPYKDFQRV